MAFFDELGKKISDASQGVVQKTKDTAETLKLNSAISDEEKKIQTLFADLGEAFFNAHADDCEEAALKDIVGEIIASKQKIEELSEQVRRLKGIIDCPYCGKQISYGVTFCSFCGKNVEEALADKQEEASAFCTNCGAAIEGGSAFCTSCGTPVAQEPAPAQEPEAETVPEAPALHCTNCGAVIEGGSAFCTSCGTPVAQEPAPAQEPEAETVPEAPAAHCTNCGVELQEGDKFCTSCGAKVE